MRRPVVLAVAAFAVVLLFAGYKMARWAHHDALPTSSVPGPPPLGTIDLIRLRGGETACVKEVGFDTDSQIAQFVATPGRGATGPPLELIARGPGYRSATPVGGGYRGRTVLGPRLQPPARSLIGDVCVRNAGRVAVDLQGSAEFRTDTRQVTTIGRRQVPNMTLTLFAAQPKNFVTSMPRMLDRAALYKAGFLHGWMLWPLLVLVAFGVPLAVLYALVSSLRAAD